MSIETYYAGGYTVASSHPVTAQKHGRTEAQAEKAAHEAAKHAAEQARPLGIPLTIDVWVYRWTYTTTIKEQPKKSVGKVELERPDSDTVQARYEDSVRAAGAVTA